MPSEGYWVVESNINTPKEAVIYFYTPGQELIHRQTVSGKRVNIKKKKTVEQLNAVLHQSLTAWNNSRQIKEGELLTTKF